MKKLLKVIGISIVTILILAAIILKLMGFHFIFDDEERGEALKLGLRYGATCNYFGITNESHSYEVIFFRLGCSNI